ncbi:MAG: hypothetical protein DVB31_16420 [Verrucomicrobia bacterium]|nr:MAG: hypothetical protein DVB31_16420 [Verrucomicrobiota bacterium]
MSQCALAVRRSAAGTLELLVYGKDKEPVLKTPLKRVESTESLPVGIQAEKTDRGGRIRLTLLGIYEATFMVLPLDL